MASFEGDKSGTRAESEQPHDLPISSLLQSQLGQTSLLGYPDLPIEEAQYPAESQK